MNKQTSVGILHLPQEANARALVCAQAASRHEERGDYERAVESLSPFWPSPSARPDTSNLSARSAAAVLLRAGSLTAWVGSKRQLSGWQEAAKNLLSESADLCASAGEIDGWIEARKHLAFCYWREGAFAEARTVYEEAIERAETGSERWLDISLNLAMVDFSEGNSAACLELFERAGTFVTAETKPFLRGRFHNGLGLTLKNTGDFDRSIIELTAASHYFDLAGYERYQIATENNLANLLVKLGQIEEAHRHLDTAERLARGLADKVYLGQTKDSRALACLAEKNYDGAEVAARESVAILEKGDEQALLVDSLTTLARALARLRDSEALATYVRAYELAADRISGERAGRIALELLGELAGDACLDGHLTLDDAVDLFESSIIGAGLAATGDRITETALRLGLSHQTLSFILKTRHKKLQPATTRTRKRRQQSIIKR